MSTYIDRIKNRVIPLWMKTHLGEFCRCCFTKENVEYHHIIPVCAGGKTEIDNLVPLCRKHHMEWHDLWYKAIKTDDEKEQEQIEEKMLDIIAPKWGQKKYEQTQ